MSEEKTILLVDDDTDNYALFRYALGKGAPGFVLRTKPDGEAALGYLSDESHPLPDYVLLDVNMPMMGGFECLREIRTTERIRCIPVIMWSSSSNEEDCRRAKCLMATAYFVKPIDIHILIQVIQSIVGQHDAPGVSPNPHIEFFLP
jgi:CheY-like chemotaxis protein